MNKKVTITISKRRYSPSVKGGAEFTSVDYSASTYGGASPCDNKGEVEQAIRHAKDVIRQEGDIPIVDNQVESRTLGGWLQ